LGSFQAGLSPGLLIEKGGQPGRQRDFYMARFFIFSVMALKKNAFRLLRIAGIVVLAIIAIAVGAGIYISADYKRILKKRLPAMVESTSDSIYHLSLDDIRVNVFERRIVVVNMKMWPDTNRVNYLRTQNRRSPNTVSFLSSPKLELHGISWKNILSSKSLDCKKMVVYDLVWFMHTVKHHPDLSTIEEPKKPGMITRMTAERFYLQNPHYTLHYEGDRNNYFIHLEGGHTLLEEWAVDEDEKKDTSTILYARKGMVRPNRFRFVKDGHLNYINAPSVDFVTSQNSVTLKNVKIKRLTDLEERTKQEKLFYNFDFPAIELVNFNWKKLIRGGMLYASAMRAEEPLLDIHFLHEDVSPPKLRMGKFPNQMLRSAIKTDIRVLHVKNGRVIYTEPGINTPIHAVLEFDNINGTFSNVTNVDTLVARNNNCKVELNARFAHKAAVFVRFDFGLGDTLGHFALAGTIKNLSAADIAEQMKALTTTEIQSFHLTEASFWEEGDQTHAVGKHTILYEDLKVALLKSKGDGTPENKKKVSSFIANKFVLYPSNPMPGEGVRTAGTAVQRDPYKGFFYFVWQNMYQALEKTTRKDNIIAKIADAKENSKPDRGKKKGFFKRLFSKLKRK
jgi:hypothetical protein